MPTYEYWDEQRQVKVEMRKPVAERDHVRAGLRRITVPQHVAIHGTTSSPINQDSADGQVPNALKALSNNEVNQMVSEGGYSVDKFKEVWGV